MLDELMDFIGSLEWQDHKPDAVDRVLRHLTLWLFCAAAGYLTGQYICGVFDIGVIGELWKQSKN
jgi:hypothetical protein